MRNIILLFTVSALLGCTPKAKPITYGETGCHYCSMTIVDQQHAAQVVTKKGKNFVFDAIECMVNHLEDKDPESLALYLVNDYDNPGGLIDATKATYLISKRIPSPMGAYLSAFTSSEAAMKTQAVHGGDLFSWKEIQIRLRKP